MTRTRVTREVEIPNRVALARLEKSPELGPNLLFFSGGTALKLLSKRIIQYTHNSIHVITPFDSGGSSAKLRQAFNMPAVGDIRNRLMALADLSFRGNPEIVALFGHRFPQSGEQDQLFEDFMRMVRGKHPLVAKIPDPMRKIVRYQLQVFCENIADGFDLHGASVGNLVLAGGYLGYRRHLDPVIFTFSNLAQVRGVVRPVVNKDLHLAADLEDGRRIVGQHLLTGKETPHLSSKIQRVFLAEERNGRIEAEPPIREKMRALIRSAELVCYPMGSFYSSVIANLLPRGVGTAVSENPCPKVYVPSTGRDPECVGMDLMDQVETLLRYLVADAPGRIRPSEVLNFVLIDKKRGNYQGRIDEDRLKQLGVELIDCPLIGYGPATDIDDRLLAPILLSLT
jgi:CofD-related protein of GAK system